MKYTDEDFYPLLYFISSIFVRIERGQMIDSSRIQEREEIEHTKEYQSLSILLQIFLTYLKMKKSLSLYSY